MLYADTVTESMEKGHDGNGAAQGKAKGGNKEHGIVPRTIIKGVREVLEITKPLKEKEKKDPAAIKKEIARLEREMLAAAQKPDFGNRRKAQRCA